MSQIDQSTPVVVVTGANRGIGLGLVENLLKNQTPVKNIPENAYIIATARDIASSTELLDLQKDHSRLHIIALDITSKESIDAFISTFKEQGFTRIDVLINNAGTAKRPDDIQDLNVDDYNRIHHVNAVGPINFTIALMDILNHTQVLKGGTLEKQEITDLSDTAVDNFSHVRIQFISSLMGSSECRMGVSPIYRSSKASLNMLASIFALNYPYLAVIVQHPGWVETRLGGPEAPLQVDESAAGCLQALSDHGYVSQSVNKMWSNDGTSIGW